MTLETPPSPGCASCSAEGRVWSLSVSVSLLAATKANTYSSPGGKGLVWIYMVFDWTKARVQEKRKFGSGIWSDKFGVVTTVHVPLAFTLSRLQ